MDPELGSRLDAIERRQRYLLVLLVYPYLVGIVWAMTGTVEERAALQAVLVAVVLVVAWYVRAAYRARSGSDA